MGMYSNSYAEIALGHSRKIMDKLTVGAKVKFLLGIYNADFHINDMKLVMSDDKWLVSGDGEFSTAGIVDIPTKLKTKDVTDDYGNIHQKRKKNSISTTSEPAMPSEASAWLSTSVRLTSYARIWSFPWLCSI